MTSEVCPCCGRDPRERFGGILYADGDRVLGCDAPGCLIEATDGAVWPWILAGNIADAVLAMRHR